MEVAMLGRQNRKPPEGSITKSITMTQVMADRVADEAAIQGHYNFSAVVTQALVEYLTKREEERAA